MKLITIGFILVGLIVFTSTHRFNLKQLTDHGLILENNFWCQPYLDCEILPFKVCSIVSNQTSSVISLINNNNNLTVVSGGGGGGQLVNQWKCKCCVAKGTNNLILRSLWFGAIKQLNKDKDNPMLTSTSTTESTSSPSTESESSTTEQSRSTNYDSISIEIINTDNNDLLINTTSNSIQLIN